MSLNGLYSILKKMIDSALYRKLFRIKTIGSLVDFFVVFEISFAQSNVIFLDVIA